VQSVQRGDNPSGTISGYALVGGAGDNEFIISTPDGVAGNEYSQRLVINPGAGAGAGEGGDIYLWAGRGGNTGGSGGDIKIRGGQGMGGGSGGYIRIEAGDSQSDAAAAGYIQMYAGTTVGGASGYVDIRGGYNGGGAGGNITLLAGQGSTNGGTVTITGGVSEAGLASYGNVSVVAGASTWTFDNTGTLTLPYATIKTTSDYAIAIGINAGTGGSSAVSLGTSAGNTNQSFNAIAIGVSAGANAQGGGATALGTNAGFDQQGVGAVAIGGGAGQYSQGESSIAIGTDAGATNQSPNSISIGSSAGTANQGAGAIAIGNVAGLGNQGINSVAIGTGAGTVSNSTNQGIGNNSIIINASGANFTGTTANAFYVNPVRNDTSNIANVVMFNAATKEITYSNTISLTGNVTTSGNITGGNLTTTGTANIGTLAVTGAATVTGNISGGNLAISGNTATITSANYQIGYLNIPQISLAANSTTALTDAGKHFYSVSASNLQLTIANNTSVSWPVGTAMTIVNRGTANVLIVPGTGVSLYLAGNSTSANRVVTTYGMATVINVAANIWMINGTVT
jgi:hypothetical protein